MITPIPILYLPGAVSVEKAFGSDIVQMVVHAGLMVKFVLLILLLFSVISWSIIFTKWILFRKAKQETDYVLDLFWDGTELKTIYNEIHDLTFSPIVHLFKSGYSEFVRIGKTQSSPSRAGSASQVPITLEKVEMSLKRTTVQQGNRLEKALSFLATTGNAAPFIGLFGTVWGIMDSFREIGMKGSASLAVVAPGISEALIATAFGLFAAIPAVVAFNIYIQKVTVLRTEMDTFALDLLSIIEKQLIQRKKRSKDDD